MNVLYLFDIDGTLLSAGGAGRRAFDIVMLRQFQIANGSSGIAFGGKTDRWLVNAVFEARLHRAADVTEIDAFLDDYVVQLDIELQAKPVTVYDGVFECLAALQALADVRLGIATGNVKSAADLKLRTAGLADNFEFGGYGCDSAHRPTLVQIAKDRGKTWLPDQPMEVIVVGDTVHDIAAARHIGAIACAVTTGGESRSELAAADVVFDSLSELPRWHRQRFSLTMTE
jgi:phosphoglycolate phosphatase